MESAPSHVTGLSNANVQSASFKMLQRALEMDEDLSQFHGSARAPRVNQGGDKWLWTSFFVTTFQTNCPVFIFPKTNMVPFLFYSVLFYKVG